MSETVIVAFLIDGGVITEVDESQLGADVTTTTHLTGPRDIRDAVARVANAPVGGEG